MALYEFNLPEEEGWQDSLAGRVILVMVGLLLYRMGFRIWGGLMPEYAIGAVATLLLFAIGTQLIILAAMDPSKFNLERWGRWISYAVLLAIFVFGTVALSYLWIDRVGTDALLFSQVGVEQLVGHGTNPYTVDMAPHVANWKGPQYATPRINGDIVRQLSYPAGAVLWFVPQYATVGATRFGIRLTLWVMAFAASALVVHHLPAKLAIGGVGAFMATRNMFAAAAGGVIWPIWVLPLILGLIAWSRERWLWAAFFVGIAAGSKQHAWLVLPFLAVWQYKLTGTPRAFLRRALPMIAVGLAVFLAMNAWFIITAPQAWLAGVLTPLNTKAPMVHQGMGLAVVSFVGAINLPAWWYALATGLAAGCALLAYWLYFDQLKWAAWVLPPVILFFYTRSLMSYFTTWGLLAVLAAAAAWGRLRYQRVAVPEADREPVGPATPGVAADD